jgi:hypothetical protein
MPGFFFVECSFTIGPEPVLAAVFNCHRIFAMRRGQRHNSDTSAQAKCRGIGTVQGTIKNAWSVCVVGRLNVLELCRICVVGKDRLRDRIFLGYCNPIGPCRSNGLDAVAG